MAKGYLEEIVQKLTDEFKEYITPSLRHGAKAGRRDRERRVS